jgi:hypothetical protein
LSDKEVKLRNGEDLVLSIQETQRRQSELMVVEALTRRSVQPQDFHLLIRNHRGGYGLERAKARPTAKVISFQVKSMECGL